MRKAVLGQPNAAGAPVSGRMWVAVVLTGVGAGLASGLLMKLLRVVQHAFFAYRRGDFLDGVAGVSPSRRVFVLVTAGVVAGLWLAAMRWARRGRAEEGESLTGAVWRRSGELATGTTMSHALLSIVAVGMGAALGREGALKDAGAVAGARFSGWLGLSAEERQLLVACGAGAGMAAAYNVPLGGALFAAEVLLGSWSLSVVLPTLMAAVVATAVSWLMLPDGVTYAMPSLPMTGALLGWAVVAGPIFGVVSVGYVRAVAWAERTRPRGVWVWALPVVVLSGLGVGAVWFPQLLGNGKNVVQLALEQGMGVPVLLWLLVLRPTATFLCLRAGIPGGLFTPTMTCGALLGALLGQGWSLLAPGTDKRGYALLGSGALLAATTQGPVSSVVFLLELTHHGERIMAPMLVAMAGATAVSRAIDARSVYSARG